MYLAKGQGQIIPRGQNFDLTKQYLLLYSYIVSSLSYIVRNFFSTFSPYKCIGTQI